MKRIAAFTLLVAFGALWSIPAKTQGMSVAEYERESRVAAKKQQKVSRRAAKKQQKMLRKTFKKQRKAMKQYQAQQKSVKKMNHHAG